MSKIVHIAWRFVSINLNTLNSKQAQFVLNFLLLVAGHFKFLKDALLNSIDVVVV